ASAPGGRHPPRSGARDVLSEWASRYGRNIRRERCGTARARRSGTRSWDPARSPGRAPARVRAPPPILASPWSLSSRSADLGPLLPRQVACDGLLDEHRGPRGGELVGGPSRQQGLVAPLQEDTSHPRARRIAREPLRTVLVPGDGARAGLGEGDRHLAVEEHDELVVVRGHPCGGALRPDRLDHVLEVLPYRDLLPGRGSRGDREDVGMAVVLRIVVDDGKPALLEFVERTEDGRIPAHGILLPREAVPRTLGPPRECRQCAAFANTRPPPSSFSAEVPIMRGN